MTQAAKLILVDCHPVAQRHKESALVAFPVAGAGMLIDLGETVMHVDLSRESDMTGNQPALPHSHFYRPAGYCVVRHAQLQTLENQTDWVSCNSGYQ